MLDYSVAIVGGDLRFVRLAQLLNSKKINVLVYGLDHPDLPLDINRCTKLEEINSCKIVIGPIPFSRDNKFLFAPLYSEKIPINDFLTASKNSFIIAGAINSNIAKTLMGTKWCDLTALDEFAILNAIPTAEGGIQYAMQHSEITIHNSKCLVLGFGRCGKILAEKLKALGSFVSVEARSNRDLSYISAYGYTPIALEDLASNLKEYDFIFNTVPTCLLTKSLIDNLRNNVVYIELASNPGGIDKYYAIQKSVHYISAPSLPGKVAPKTAAEIIYHCLLIIIRNQGACI